MRGSGKERALAVNEQRREERRTAVDAEAEEYTSAEPVGGVESIVEARAPGHERGTTDRHARRTLVRPAARSPGDRPSWVRRSTGPV